jgi:hypothetical protein
MSILDITLWIQSTGGSICIDKHVVLIQDVLLRTRKQTAYFN